MLRSTGTASKRTAFVRPDAAFSTPVVTLSAACQVGPTGLLLLTRLEGSTEAVRAVRLLGGDGKPQIQSRWHALGAHQDPANAGSKNLLLIGHREQAIEREPSALLVEVMANGAESPLTLTVPSGAFADLRTVLRELAGLDDEDRTDIRALITDYFSENAPHFGRFSLGRELSTIRNALREPHPPCPRGPGEARGLNVDGIHALDARGFWIRGWFVDRDATLRRLTAISPEGYLAELLPSVFRCRRPDVEAIYPSLPVPAESASGFIAFAELPAPSFESEGWVVEMENALGDVHEVLAPPVVRNPASARDAVLGDFAQQDDTGFAEAHVLPALTRLQAEVHQAGIATILQLGAAPSDPAVTVVVPLYKRLEFLEVQLAHFQHDPDLRRADLVYVLDSPEQQEELERNAKQLHALYGIPFRIITMARNVGFAGANNAAASEARGHLLLLLNSDVVPDAPGWLGRMVSFYRANPNLGVIGPKLLFEDETIQHAGLYFERAGDADVWENAHYFKGMHRGFGPACQTRAVPAVTGACAMVDRHLFHDIGGLRGDYVQGDYEDSDLCLRLLELGRENWYLADVELYHLEAQSYPNGMRRAATRYNRWRHSQLWGERIEELARDGRFGIAVRGE